MQGVNWPPNVCTDCVVKLNEMCQFRKNIIDNQITIEQTYGPVVLDAAAKILPSSFISESSVITHTDHPSEVPELPVNIPEVLDIIEESPDVEQIISPRTRRSTRSSAVAKETLVTQVAPIITAEDNLSDSNSNDDPHDDDQEKSVDNTNQKYKNVDDTIYNFIKLNCTLCPESGFKTFTQLRYHYSKKHSVKGFVVCCNVKHLRRHKLYEHIQFHMNPDTFKCSTCSKSFNSSHNLATHVKMTHLTEDEKKHQCEKCEQKFGTPFQLKQHMMRHVGEHERSFKCPECPKLFPGRPHLYSHIKFVHEKRKRFSCDHCQKLFTSKTVLENHVSSAHKDATKGTSEASPQLIKCDHCSKIYLNERSLKKHLSRLNLTGEKHICEDCGHEAPTISALKSHIYRSHNDQPQIWNCETCGKQFKSCRSLKEHLATHTGESLYTCLFCPKKFNSNANKYKHQKTLHPKEWAAKRKL